MFALQESIPHRQRRPVRHHHGITLREGELPSSFQTTLTCGAEFAELPNSPLRGIVLHAWENGSSVERTLFWEGGNFFADDGWALQPE